jgi:ribonucleotide monophosphatase NagD (HAD superfamily)
VTTLVASDVDGTLDSSAGPVKVARLRSLEGAGIQVVIVSPSGARPAGFAEEIGGERTANLRAAHERFPSALCLYVSDNGDREVAKAAGFVYIEASDFAV